MFNPNNYKDTPNDDDSEIDENDEGEVRSGPVALLNPLHSQQQWSQNESLATAIATKNSSFDEVGFWNANNRTADPFARAPTLTKRPEWVAPSSTFISNKDASEVYDALKDALERYDTEANDASYEIRGIMYSPARCSFCVNMFADENSILVEFQRRSGCSLVFTTLYNDALCSLAPIISRLYSSTIPFEHDPRRQRAPKPLLCSMLDDFACTDDEFNETFEGFCMMLADPYFESQQGVGCSLTQWLQSDDNTSRLAIDHLLRLGHLVSSSLLSSAHNELLHYGSVSMDLLLQTAQQMNGITNDLAGLVPAMVSILRSPDMLENRDTKRRVASGLKSLASNSTIASQIASCKADLELYQKSSDNALRDSVQSLLKAL